MQKESSQASDSSENRQYGFSRGVHHFDLNSEDDTLFFKENCSKIDDSPEQLSGSTSKYSHNEEHAEDRATKLLKTQSNSTPRQHPNKFKENEKYLLIKKQDQLKAIKAELELALKQHQIQDIDELQEQISRLQLEVQKLLKKQGKTKRLQTIQKQLEQLQKISHLNQIVIQITETQNTHKNKLSILLKEYDIKDSHDLENKIQTLSQSIQAMEEQGDSQISDALKLLDTYKFIKELWNKQSQNIQQDSDIQQVLYLMTEQLKKGLDELDIDEDANLDQVYKNKKKAHEGKKLLSVNSEKIRRLEEEQAKLANLIQIKNKISQLKKQNKKRKNTCTRKQYLKMNDKKSLIHCHSQIQTVQHKEQKQKKKVKEKIKTFQDGLIERYCTVKLINGQVKKIIYSFDQTCQSFCNRLGISLKNKKIQFAIKKERQFQIVDSHQHFFNLLNKYDNIEGRLLQFITVQFKSQKQSFIKGTPASQIRKRMKVKGYNLYFFTTESYNLIDQDEETKIEQNAKIIECERCNIHFKEEFQRDCLVPIHQKLSQAIKYLKISGPQTVFISECKFEGKWNPVSEQETFHKITKGRKVQQIRISYKIYLIIDVFSHKKLKQIQFMVVSNEPLHKIKDRFQGHCKIVAKHQKWIVNEKQMENNETFESLEVNQKRYQAEVHQIINLQYYGFSQQILIKQESYREFYIQNDEQFIQIINESNFPSSLYEYSFRVMSLGLIFAAVKKHCRIQFALNCIRQLVASSEKHEQLWQAKSSKDKTFFNEHYALHNILHSGDTNLKIDFMRVYKHHSPLPLFSFNSKGKLISFLQYHYWICNKSLTIISIQLNQHINGKSTFLNKIFNTDFQINDGRHPICSRSVYIQYNIFKNQDMLVDLIDISSNSIGQKEKLTLCKMCNLLIIHYTIDRYQETIKWLEKNCPNKFIILVQRDSTLMDSRDNFKKQMLNNSQKTNKKTFGVPVITPEIYRHYKYNFQQISDQINIFVEEIYNQLESSPEKWNFSFFAAQEDKVLIETTNKIIKVQKQFSQMINRQEFQENKQYNFEQIPLNKNLNELLTIKQEKYCEMFMSKLRQFIRITRTKRLKVFSPIYQIQSLLEKQNEKAIKQAFPKIKKLVNQLLDIPINQTTPFFRSNVQFIHHLQENYIDIHKLKEVAKKISQNFIFEIKPREFSIQNFWRVIAKLYISQQKKEKNFIQILDETKMLYAKQFVYGRSFEVINGDSLEMPIGLLRSNIIQHQQKKIMVIGIFGPQSSGKSTLLNFLFGCDFLSSDGRCTSGVYGTYYEINNKIVPNCNGFLLLDTEGLFANYQRRDKKGQNFDNKLVLFLIKVCDILILNTRGDVDKNCENILDLAFDSELMEHKKGTKYPNFYMVLNQTAGSMNAQQQSEVRGLRDKIVAVAPNMEDYISTNQSNSMPIAFNTAYQQIRSKQLKRLQMKSKTPTEQFYTQTKNLALKLIKILQKRGKSTQGRSLGQIYDQMHAVWSTIISLPMLTKYTSRMIKKFQDQITICKYDFNKRVQQTVKKWKSQIPKDLRQLVQWETKKKKQFQVIISDIIQQFRKKFPEGSDPQRNSLINNAVIQIQPKMLYYFQRLLIEISTIKYMLEVQQSQNRGLDSISRAARELRYRSYLNGVQIDPKQSEEKFQQVWYEYTQKMNQKINHKEVSCQAFKSVQSQYDRLLRCSHTKVILPQKLFYPLSYQMSFQQYSRSLMNASLKKCDQKMILEVLNIQPVISTPKSGATELTFKYLDMRQFFQFKLKTFSLFFRASMISECIDSSSIQNSIKQKIQKNHQTVSFVQQIGKDLQKIKTNINKSLISSKISNLVLKNHYNKRNQAWRQRDYGYQHLIFVTPQDTKSILIKILKGEYSRLQFHRIKPHQFLSEIKKQHGWFGLAFNTNKPISRIINQSIQSFVSQNYDHFQRICQQLFCQTSLKIISQFSQIGIHLQNVDILPNKLQFSLKQPKPIQLKHSKILKDKISSFSYFFKKNTLEMNITDVEYYGNYKIAEYFNQQIQVKEGFKSQKILNLYKNKEFYQLTKGIRTPVFIDFVSTYINTHIIYESLVNQVRNIHPKTDTETCIVNLMAYIKKEIADFNKDLMQISQQLTFRFKIHLHQFCFLLLWKFTEERDWKQRQNFLQHLTKEKTNQKQIFFKILDNDPEKNSDVIAEIFFTKYRDFMQIANKSERRLHIQEAQRQFLLKYTRERVQTWVDADMAKSQDSKKIFDYLTNPAHSLVSYYQTFIDMEEQKLQQTFSSSISSCYNEIMNVINSIRDKVVGQQELWVSDDIIASGNPAIIVRQIFIRLLSIGDSISSDGKDNPFCIKPGVIFEVKQATLQNWNQNFLKQMFDFQIINYAMFINYLSKHLLKNQKEFEEKLKISKDDLVQFRLNVKLKLCDFSCPCCGRLCDIDMRQDPHHKRHKCSSGHQMRAVQGIRIQKKVGSMKQYYASILRCEDIQDFSVFKFNGKDYKWRQFYESKKQQWDFKGSQVIKQQQLFENMWSKAGRQICIHREKLDELPMIYEQYSQQSVYLQQKASEVQYIFAIDGSGSMKGQPWSDLIYALKQILRDLSVNSDNKVSIIVFTSSYSIIYQNKQASSINVNTIAFPGGGTTFGAAFNGAIQVMSSIVTKMNLSFIFISDGCAEYPTLQINQMKGIKAQSQQSGHEFRYVSIYIGGGGTPSLMEQMTNDLNGESRWVNNSSQVATTFKEIFVTKQ